MPLKVPTPKQRRSYAAALCAALLVLLAAHAPALAQRRQRARQTPPTAQTNTNAQAPSAQQARRGRITPLQAKETAGGSRVTITSDSRLNDYTAYRSGDRYVVVLP
ncbi:MAG TPA: hypothetical protein VGV38_08755, partial [Pyrinomonadaceae bacterium]|nr:hypothetical protein [Pyrinomonadaceae bacterium]